MILLLLIVYLHTFLHFHFDPLWRFMLNGYLILCSLFLLLFYFLFSRSQKLVHYIFVDVCFFFTQEKFTSCFRRNVSEFCTVSVSYLSWCILIGFLNYFLISDLVFRCFLGLSMRCSFPFVNISAADSFRKLCLFSVVYQLFRSKRS